MATTNMINVAGGIQDTDACTSNVVRYEVDGAPKPGESSGWLRHDTFDAALADALDRGVLVITAISRDANGVAVARRTAWAKIDRSSPCLCNGLVGNAVRDALRAAS